ncbi:MAG: hypothetical protein DCC55_36205 [Chloroflexi bacterium]|nr:MAG: hypothetical protein DCC55_36205 [Chloroflexota bacterium]
MDNVQSMVQRLKQLTKREQEVLELRGQGKMIKEIAQALSIRERTVKFHLAHIYEKLDLQDLTTEFERLEAVREFSQVLNQLHQLESAPAEIESEAEEFDIDKFEIAPQSLVLVLEDEIELAQETTALQPAVISIPPPHDSQFSDHSQKNHRRRTALLVITSFVLFGAFLGAGITALFFSLRADTPFSAIETTSTNQINSEPQVARQGLTSSGIASSSVCGEMEFTPYDVKPIFLRHQGVSAFTVENSNGAILNNFARTVALDSRGLWIGYAPIEQNPINGVGLYTRGNWVICRSGVVTSGVAINDIEIDVAGRVWVATDGAGVSVFDGGEWRTYTTEDSLPSDAIFGLAIDDKGAIWAATLAGVATLDGDTWKVPYSASNSRLVTNKTHALAFDSQGNIWVGHIEAGVSQYDNATATWRYYSAEADGLGGDQIRDIVVRKANADTPESIWFATADGGLSKFEDGKWTIYRTQDGLPSNTVIGVALDKYNRVWAATAGGVAYLEGTKWISYNTLNTLAIAFGPTCQDCPIDDDHVWTGTAEMGLTHSRLPHLNNDAAVKIEAICFELIVERKQECVPLRPRRKDSFQDRCCAPCAASITPGSRGLSLEY